MGTKISKAFFFSVSTTKIKTSHSNTCPVELKPFLALQLLLNFSFFFVEFTLRAEIFFGPQSKLSAKSGPKCKLLVLDPIGNF